MATKLDKLDKIAKKVSEDAALACAQRVADELTWRAKECVAEFYAEYEPKYYDRWGQLETTPHEHIKREHVSGSNIIGYEFGVKIDTRDMEELYEISAEKVFDLAIGHGYHGLPGYMLADYRESIKYKSTVEKMDAYFEEIKKKIPNYLTEELNKAFSKYASTLK